MGQKLKPHDAVRVKVGKVAGLAGVILEADEQAQKVRVKVQGVKDGEPVDFDAWLSVKSVERAQ